MKKIISFLSITFFAIFFSVSSFSVVSADSFGPFGDTSNTVGNQVQTTFQSQQVQNTSSNSSGISSGCSSISSLDGVVNCVSGFFNAAVYILMSFALLYTVWSALQFMRADGEGRDEWRSKIVAGIIGLFVMSAIWGLVNILKGTFSLNNTPVSPPTIRLGN